MILKVFSELGDSRTLLSAHVSGSAPSVELEKAENKQGEALLRITLGL